MEHLWNNNIIGIQNSNTFNLTYSCFELWAKKNIKNQIDNSSKMRTVLLRNNLKTVELQTEFISKDIHLNYVFDSQEQGNSPGLYEYNITVWAICPKKAKYAFRIRPASPTECIPRFSIFELDLIIWSLNTYYLSIKGIPDWQNWTFIYWIRAGSIKLSRVPNFPW